MKFRPLAFDYHTEAERLISSEKQKRKEESIIWIQPTSGQHGFNRNDDAPASSKEPKQRGPSATALIEDWKIGEANKLVAGPAQLPLVPPKTMTNTSEKCYPPKRTTMFDESAEKASTEILPRILRTPAPAKKPSSAVAIVTEAKATKKERGAEENDTDCKLVKFFRSPENSSEWKEAGAMLSMALDACDAEEKEEIAVNDKSAAGVDESGVAGVVLGCEGTKKKLESSCSEHDKEVQSEAPSKLNKEELIIEDLTAAPKLHGSEDGDECIDQANILVEKARSMVDEDAETETLQPEKDNIVPMVPTERAGSRATVQAKTEKHSINPSIDPSDKIVVPCKPEGKGEDPMESEQNERKEALARKLGCEAENDSVALSSMPNIKDTVVEQPNQELPKQEQEEKEVEEEDELQQPPDMCRVTQVEMSESTQTTSMETTSIEKNKAPIDAVNLAAAGDEGGSQVQHDDIETNDSSSSSSSSSNNTGRLANDFEETPMPNPNGPSPSSCAAFTASKEYDDGFSIKGDSPTDHKMTRGSPAALKGLAIPELAATAPEHLEEGRAQDPSLLAARAGTAEALADPQPGQPASLPPIPAEGGEQEPNATNEAAGADETEECPEKLATKNAEHPSRLPTNERGSIQRAEDVENEMQQQNSTSSAEADKSSFKRKHQNQPQVALANCQKRPRIELGGESGEFGGSATRNDGTEGVENSAMSVSVPRKALASCTVEATSGGAAATSESGTGDLELNESLQAAKSSKRLESEGESKPHHQELQNASTYSSKMNCLAMLGAEAVAREQHGPISGKEQRAQPDLALKEHNVLAVATTRTPIVLQDKMVAMNVIETWKGGNLALSIDQLHHGATPVHQQGILEETNNAVSSDMHEFSREDGSDPILQNTFDTTLHAVNQDATRQEAGEETAFPGEKIHAHSSGEKRRCKEEEKRRRKKERKLRKKEKKELQRRREKKRKRQTERVSVKDEPIENEDEIVCLGVRQSPKEPMVRDVCLPRAVSSWEPKQKKPALDPSNLTKPAASQDMARSHLTSNANETHGPKYQDPNPSAGPLSKVNAMTGVPMPVPGSGSESKKASANSFASMPPVKLLCSVGFLERWGEAFIELNSGRWTSSFLHEASTTRAAPATSITLGRKFAFVDVEFLTVDIELPASTGMIIESLSAWGEDEQHSRTFMSKLLRLAATERYKSLHVLLVCNLDLSDHLSKQILKLQNAFLGQDCPVQVQVRMSSIVALSYCIARVILPALRSEEMTKYQEMLSKLPANGAIKDGVISRSSFLCRLLPTLNAMSSMQLMINTGHSNSPEHFRLLLQNRIERSKISATATSMTKPMLQLSTMTGALLRGSGMYT